MPDITLELKIKKNDPERHEGCKPITFSKIKLAAVLSLLILAWTATSAQTSEISFQGSLNAGGQPANGNYDIEFRLFGAPAGGSAIGTVTRLNVPVTEGLFAVQLNFPAGSFDGSDRFVEISVRAAGGPAYQLLSPRQQVASSPYSIRSQTAANALLLGGVSASGFVLSTDPRLTDARAPLPNSGDYIQNRVSPQSPSNFNVTGNGSVGGTLSGGTVNSNTQYNLGGMPVLRATGANNTFVGIITGESNTTGANNSYLGTFAGSQNTTGRDNTFVGAWAGRFNTTGISNSAVGAFAGAQNTTGSNNSFFGQSSGNNNTGGDGNAFFGARSGLQNTTGNSNSFFGNSAGENNVTGGGNSFFGARAGEANTTGMTNSFFGAGSGAANTTGQNNAFFGINAGAASVTAIGNSFFGANAGAATTAQFNSFFGASSGLVNTTGVSNSFFGTVTGVANTTGSNNSFFGHWAGHDNTTGNSNSAFGAFAGEATTSGDFNLFAGRSSGEFTTTGNGNTFLGYQSGVTNTVGSNNTLLGSGSDVFFNNLSYATAIGAGATVNTNNTISMGRTDGSDRVIVRGHLIIGTFGTSATAELCVNGSLQVGLCSSSLRYKTNVADFTGGLDILRRLRPISYNWRADGYPDVGFAAEEVNAVEPRFVQFGPTGKIEGVRYGQLTTVLVNAAKEQQIEIERQRAEIDTLRKQLEAMRAVLCAMNESAEICKP